jgi:hypothetical protein
MWMAVTTGKNPQSADFFYKDFPMIKYGVFFKIICDRCGTELESKVFSEYEESEDYFRKGIIDTATSKGWLMTDVGKHFCSECATGAKEYFEPVDDNTGKGISEGNPFASITRGLARFLRYKIWKE